MFILNFKTSPQLYIKSHFHFNPIFTWYSYSYMSSSTVQYFFFIIIILFNLYLTRKDSEQNSSLYRCCQTEQDTLIMEGYEVNWKQVGALFHYMQSSFCQWFSKSFFYYFQHTRLFPKCYLQRQNPNQAHPAAHLRPWKYCELLCLAITATWSQLRDLGAERWQDRKIK